LSAEAFITFMDGTSRSPPPGREADEWATALESAGGEWLRAHLRQMVGSAVIVEDILQDACEKFLRHLGEGRQASGGWVRTVTLRVAVSYLRREQRQAEVMLPPPEEAPELATASTLESEAETDESVRRCQAALLALRPEQRRLMDLHYWRGMKVEEIAELWGISREAVELRLTRARNRLRALLEDIRGADPE